MTVTFLFWNLHQSDLSESLVRLCRRHSVDVLILAELGSVEPARLLFTLNAPENDLGFHYAPGHCERLHLFTRFGRDTLTEVDSHKHYTFRRLIIPQRTELLLVAAHLLSPLHADLETRNEEARKLAREIVKQEEQQGNTRTLVVGDLNLNPFDSGIAGASGLHGIMDPLLASERTGGREVQRVFYRFFYNPMWGCLGKNEQPLGSYFYPGKGQQLAYFWHIFDQVLIRPELLSNWDGPYLRLLTEDGVLQFLQNNGRPDVNRASDHLPLLFRFNFAS